MSLEPLLQIRGLTTSFISHEEPFHAVDDVSMSVWPGEVVALVGETGSGKSVTCLSVMRLIDSPGRITAGEILFSGKNLLAMSEKNMREIRGREIGMIFQNPRASLNPVFTIGDQIGRVVRHHTGVSRREARKQVVELLRSVDIADPGRCARSYPHQISGGMCQRVMLVIATCSTPSLLIADEATTGLDVTIQAQVVDLIAQRVRSAGTTCLFVTHDLGLVAEVCDRVYVMYAGRIVEEGPVAQVFDAPRHPYTQGLLASTLRLDGNRELAPIPGALDVTRHPSGCTFHPRCRFAATLCIDREPDLLIVDEHRKARCHLVSGDVSAANDTIPAPEMRRP